MFKAITIVAALLTGAQAAGTGLRHRSNIVTMGHVAPAIAALAPLEAIEANVVAAGTEASFVETKVGYKYHTTKCSWWDTKCHKEKRKINTNINRHRARQAQARANAARNAEREKIRDSKKKMILWGFRHAGLIH